MQDGEDQVRRIQVGQNGERFAGQLLAEVFQAAQSEAVQLPGMRNSIYDEPVGDDFVMHSMTYAYWTKARDTILICRHYATWTPKPA